MAGFLGSAFAAENFSDRLVSWLINDCHLAISESLLNILSVIVITIILSYFTLIFGELVPKRIAMKKADAVARAVSGVITALSVVLKPVIWFLTISTNGVLRLFGINPKEEDEPVSEEEIIMMLDVGEENGTIDLMKKR